jgi:hypothetical protein
VVVLTLLSLPLNDYFSVGRKSVEQHPDAEQVKGLFLVLMMSGESLLAAKVLSAWFSMSLIVCMAIEKHDIDSE